MLANDIVLDKADGTDVTFRLTQSDQTGTRRIDIGSTLALPATLIIKHSVSGKTPNVIDRHLVQVNKTVATTLGSTAVTANFTLTVPRDVAVTAVIIHDVVSHLLDFLDDGALTGFASTVNVDALLRGES